MTRETKTDIIALGNEWFQKAPALPKNGREGLVKATPWIALIFGILMVFLGIGALGFAPIAFFAGPHASFMVMIAGLGLLIGGVMMLMAYPKVSKRLLSGWTLLFWAEGVNVIADLLMGEIFSAIIGGLLGFYLLYQIKSYYK